MDLAAAPRSRAASRCDALAGGEDGAAGVRGVGLEPAAQRAAPAREDGGVLVQLPAGVHGGAERVELERELLGVGVRPQLAAVDRLADVLRRAARPSASSARRRRRGPGPGARPSPRWRRRRSSRRRRRRARCSPARRAASSTGGRARARAPRSAGAITRCVKIAAAARTVETCSSSLEPKWANRPLLLIWSSEARRPIERPSRPSTEATFTAACRIARRVLSP